MKSIPRVRDLVEYATSEAEVPDTKEVVPDAEGLEHWGAPIRSSKKDKKKKRRTNNGLVDHASFKKEHPVMKEVVPNDEEWWKPLPWEFTSGKKKKKGPLPGPIVADTVTISSDFETEETQQEQEVNANYMLRPGTGSEGEVESSVAPQMERTLLDTAIEGIAIQKQDARDRIYALLGLMDGTDPSVAVRGGYEKNARPAMGEVDVVKRLRADDMTPLQVRKGDEEIMRPLLEHGATVEQPQDTAGMALSHQLDPHQFVPSYEHAEDSSSDISLADSIFSEASIASALTDPLVTGPYSAAKVETATRELLRIFLENESLVPLYEVAVGSPRIGSVRLRKKIHGLLKAFAQKLQREAGNELEKLAGRLVRAKASYVAVSVVEKFEVQLSRPRAQTKSLEVEDVSGGEDDEDPIDEDLIEDLAAFRRFLTAGSTFEHFRSELRSFVYQRSKAVPLRLEPEKTPEVDLQHQTTKFETELVREVTRSRVSNLFTRLFVTIGYLEPPLTPGWVRLRWQCRCGERLFGDVKEYRVGGVAELVEKMNLSTGAKVTVTPHSMASANRNWAFKAPNWMRKIIRGSSTSKAGAPYSLEDLPQHTSADQSSISTTLTQVTDVTILSEPSLYLMACAHKTERRRHLLQDPIDSVSTDRALFHFMKQQLRRNQSRARQFFSMRSVQGMYFVKFRLQMGNFVEVRDHDPCCTSIMPHTCECIPPTQKVEPATNAEYRCAPAGPLARWPPVLSQDLMHMLSSPECINDQVTWVLEQLPKRTAGKLQERAKQPVEGWGIYYQEGIDWDMVIGAVFLLFLLGSLLFAILWTTLKMDIQGAFGVSSYMVTASGIFLAWLASRAKNYG